MSLAAKHMLRPSIVALACFLAGACGPRREPIYVDLGLAKGDYTIATVGLMPVIDVRPDPFQDVEVLSHARSASERVLAGKGYTVVAETVASPEAPLAAAELAKMGDAELARLGPSDREFFLYIYVERLDKGFDEYGAESRVTVSGVLFRRGSEKPVWRDRAVGDSNLTGFFTLFSGPTIEYEAVYQAIRVLFSTLPDHKKA
jgi:hypothetical protein